MLTTKNKSIRISTIRRAASKLAGVPGNLLINGQWFSSREWRNCLIGNGLNPDIPVMAFNGGTIRYKELEITQAMLDAGNGEVKHTVNGREVTYKKPGVNNIELDIDFATVNVTDAAINLTKLSTMMPDRRNAPRPTTPAAAPAVSDVEEVEEIGGGEQVNTNTGEILPPPNGEHVEDLVNANDQQGVTIP